MIIQVKRGNDKQREAKGPQAVSSKHVPMR